MMDNDNDTDLVAIGWQSNKISWFENRLEDPNLLNIPESVVYDSVYKRYLVSNCGDGNIIQIDSSGQQDYFNTELTVSVGIHIVGDTLFVSSDEGVYSGVVGFLLSTGEMVFHVNIAEKQLLNDITSDLAGNLYVTDSDANKIYKVRINDMTYTTFVNSGLGWPNGIMYDKQNDRLLVLSCGLPNRPLLSVNMEDSTVSTVVNTGTNANDGITADDIGNTYFASWSTGKVYRYDESFTNPPEVVSSGHSGPADIFFENQSNIIAVPNTNSNSVDFIQITFTNQNEISKNNIEINRFFPNPFTDNINFEFYLPAKAHTKIFVYDILGNRIAELINEELNRGDYSISWNGRDKNDKETSQGIYFIFFNIEDHFKTYKVIKH
jgi:sugar lactone lactonase YvrE